MALYIIKKEIYLLSLERKLMEKETEDGIEKIEEHFSSSV